MNFNHFCSISGEDFAIENHEYVVAGKKEYLKDCTIEYSLFRTKDPPSQYNRLLGFGQNFFLVGILKRYEDVYYFTNIMFFNG
jgi:hypothetical protein